MKQRTTNYALWAYICVIGGALAGIAFVALFIRGPHWVFSLSSVAFGYAGGYLGAQMYKGLFCRTADHS